METVLQMAFSREICWHCPDQGTKLIITNSGDKLVSHSYWWMLRIHTTLLGKVLTSQLKPELNQLLVYRKHSRQNNKSDCGTSPGQLTWAFQNSQCQERLKGREAGRQF